MKVKIYTDGSADSITGICSAAFIILNENDEEIYQNAIPLGYGNSVRGETQAVIMALKYAIEVLNAKEIDIYYDFDGISEWVMGNWKTKSCNAIIYFREFMKLKKKLNKINFFKIKSHSGNELNNRVDRLAYNALKASMVRK